MHKILYYTACKERPSPSKLSVEKHILMQISFVIPLSFLLSATSDHFRMEDKRNKIQLLSHYYYCHHKMRDEETDTKKKQSRFLALIVLMQSCSWYSTPRSPVSRENPLLHSALFLQYLARTKETREAKGKKHAPVEFLGKKKFLLL